MPAIQTTLRTSLKTIVDAAAPTLPITDFTTEETYYPKTDLETLAEKPVVKFVAMGFNTNRDRLLRDMSLTVEVPCQIAIQQRINPSNLSAIDLLVEFAEAIQNAVETDTINGYSWLRTEMLKDENGMVYSYAQLTERNVFMVIFTPIYKYLKQPS